MLRTGSLHFGNMKTGSPRYEGHHSGGMPVPSSGGRLLPRMSQRLAVFRVTLCHRVLAHHSIDAEPAGGFFWFLNDGISFVSRGGFEWRWQRFFALGAGIEQEKGPQKANML
jgi:hypothetical protein